MGATLRKLFGQSSEIEQLTESIEELNQQLLKLDAEQHCRLQDLPIIHRAALSFVKQLEPHAKMPSHQQKTYRDAQKLLDETGCAQIKQAFQIFAIHERIMLNISRKRNVLLSTKQLLLAKVTTAPYLKHMDSFQEDTREVEILLSGLDKALKDKKSLGEINQDMFSRLEEVLHKSTALKPEEEEEEEEEVRPVRKPKKKGLYSSVPSEPSVVLT